MKKLITATLLIGLLSFSAHANIIQRIQQLANEIEKEVGTNTHDIQDLFAVHELLAESNKILTLGSNIEENCIRFLVSTTYTEMYARRLCKDIKTAEFRCMKPIVRRGTMASSALKTCNNVSHIESHCISFLVGKGTFHTSAQRHCENIERDEFVCFKKEVNAGQFPSTARRKCSR